MAQPKHKPGTIKVIHTGTREGGYVVVYVNDGKRVPGWKEYATQDEAQAIVNKLTSSK